MCPRAPSMVEEGRSEPVLSPGLQLPSEFAPRTAQHDCPVCFPSPLFSTIRAHLFSWLKSWDLVANRILSDQLHYP